MPTHSGEAIIASMSAVEMGDVAVFRVTTKDELATALRERTLQIIIGDKKLARPFELLLWAKELRWWYLATLVAVLAGYLIWQSVGVKLKGEWDLGRHRISGEVILTPTRPRAPSSLSEE